MLRAIAWAGRRPVDVLTNAPAPPERGAGRAGGRGAGAARGQQPQ
jgi:hypothetical protein